MNIAIIFAGGSGVRMGAGIPKQFLEVNGKPILIHTVQLFQFHRKIDKIYISAPTDYIPYVESLVQEYHLTKVSSVISGGETAQDSIYNALKKAESENPDDSIVLLHDGVRPFVPYEVISSNIKSVKEYGSAITSTPCYETIFTSVNADGKNEVETVPIRSHTYCAQAPQSFRLKEIINAHDRIRASENGYENMVDSCTIYNALGLPVHFINGNRGNIKVTTPEDFYILRALLDYRENEQAFGFGLTHQTRIDRWMNAHAEDDED
ncbi:MAG: 2-C-methyl-D-erythritol 4-phosphate cytidylyltransferase [Oscillospiraceae bacterium]|nr:2-C-methyl-D-erythritol 4-phosphate cytidylyltransferase [Oscillospiraceae bacterium]